MTTLEWSTFFNQEQPSLARATVRVGTFHLSRIKLCYIPCASVLSADKRLRADQCVCVGTGSIRISMNCIFNILGILNCKQRRDSSTPTGERDAIEARQAADMSKNDIVETEEESNRMDARYSTNLSMKNPFDTEGESNAIKPRQRGFSGYALNCAFNREATNFCANAPHY